MIYSINEGRIPIRSNKNIIDIEAIYNEGIIIKDCSYLITESMMIECMNNTDIVRQVAILEGAKLDLQLSNWMKEGKDYKGLKKDLKEIINANNMDKSELASKGKGFMHTCKRILQICCDIDAAFMPGASILSTAAKASVLSAAGAAAGIPGVIVLGIIGFVINFIINRLMRLLVDTIEFNTIKKDAEDIVDDLRSKAKTVEDPSAAKKLNSEADKLEKSIKKYSNK